MQPFISWIGKAIGVVLCVIGLAGIPDDLHTWATWLSPLSDMIDVINHEVSRYFLVIAGIAIVAWPRLWSWFGGFRSRTTSSPDEDPRQQSVTESFHTSINNAITTEGDYERVCAITVKNLESLDLEKRCLVQIEEINVQVPASMPMPFVLRTEGQIRGKRFGRFTLSSNQPKTVPILFRKKVRKNEWYLFDEHAKNYYIPSGPLELRIGIYGGHVNCKLLVAIDVDEDWSANASLIDISARIEVAG